ncbi:hypothetical protein Dimus_026242 [Dionaea muscipula]
MTNLYELQDIVWDEFGEGDDHLVPVLHPGNKRCDESLAETQGCKRTRAEIPVVSRNTDAIAPNNVSLNKEDNSLISLKEKEEIMLERGSWTNSSDGASCDDESNNRTFNANSEAITDLKDCLKTSPMKSVGGELYAEDPILGDHGAAIEDNLYRYPLSQTISTENNLNFFNGDHQDKENSDLSYYGWPDIQNFEDVDRMFRSCDLTFGLGIDNDDELSWFSSAQAIEGSNDVLKSSFRFQGSDAEILSIATGSPEVSRQTNSSPSANDGDMKLVPPRTRAKKLIGNGPLTGTSSSLANESEVIQTDKGKQINLRVKQQKSPEGKKHEYKSRNSASRKESSHASNHSQTVQKSDDFSLQNITMLGVEKRGPFHQLGAGHPGGADITAQTACGSISCQKQVPNCENEIDVYSEVNGYSTGTQAELDSTNAQESCSINSLLDEVSLEAISFLQLQRVMEQLDLRTKLCIRDSLYRLARSAEQRHKCGNTANGSNYDKDASALTSDETNKCTGLLDIETDTNPIDRSIAHLLFHRPPDSSAVPVLNLSPRLKGLDEASGPCSVPSLLQLAT